MKRLFFIVLVLLVLIITCPAFAADTVTPSYFKQPNGTGFVITLIWQAAASGTKANYVIPTDIIKTLYERYYLYSIITKPGGTAPADLYDLTILDTISRDILGGGGTNRSSTLIQEAFPSTVPQMITGALTVTWANVTNANATGTLILKFAAY